MILNPHLEDSEGYNLHASAVRVFNAHGEPIHAARRGEDNPPSGWCIWYVWQGVAQHAPDPVAWDPSNDIGFAQPETRYASHAERIKDGQSGFAMFSFYRIHHGGLFQTVTGLQPGARYAFTIANHAWASSNDDPLTSNGEHGAYYADLGSELDWSLDNPPSVVYAARVGIDLSGGRDPFSEAVEWGRWATSLNVYNDLPAVTFTALETTATIFTEHLFPWPLKHCDAYYDAAILNTISPPPDPPPPPQPGLDFYPPRVPYARTYVLVHPQADREWVQAAVKAGWDERRWTVGGSADDAGIGPPHRTVIAVNPHRWSDDLETFFATHYPGAVFVPVEAADPDLLYNRLSDLVSGNGSPEPPPEEPPPQPTPQPPEEEPSLPGFVNLPRNLAGGIHAMGVFTYWRELLTQAPPSAVKVFSAGDAYHIGAFAREHEGVTRPKTRTIWRRYVPNDAAYVNVPDRRASAAAFLELYKLELATAARGMGTTEAELLRCIDYIGSLNEVIGTWDPETPRLVEFDCYFAELLEEWTGEALKATLLTVAVGNPHETEVNLLLPVAKLSHEKGHLLDYHAYWTATRQQSFLDEHWIYHSGRALDGWDPVFRSYGYYPLYVAGESGVVASHKADGTDFGGGQSWKALGDFPNYLRQIRRRNERILAWNASHNDRCLGDTLFTGEFWGWDDFKIGSGDLLLLIQEASTW